MTPILKVTAFIAKTDLLTLHAGSLDGQQFGYEWAKFLTGYQHSGADWQLGQLGMNDDGNFQVTATNP